MVPNFCQFKRGLYGKKKLSKDVKNGQQRSTTVKTVFWSKKVQKGKKLSKTFKNGQQWSKPSIKIKNGQYGQKKSQNAQKLSTSVKNGKFSQKSQKLVLKKMVKNGQNSQKQ